MCYPLLMNGSGSWLGCSTGVLCREFDISRETGYKIFQRYEDCGVGLPIEGAAPIGMPTRLPVQLERLIVRLRREHPSRGASKIR